MKHNAMTILNLVVYLLDLIMVLALFIVGRISCNNK